MIYIQTQIDQFPAALLFVHLFLYERNESKTSVIGNHGLCLQPAYLYILRCMSTSFAGIRFVLFNDTRSQRGHSVSCMIILFLNLQITTSDIRLHIKWAVGLVNAYSHFKFSSGVCVGVYGLTSILFCDDIWFIDTWHKYWCWGINNTTQPIYM